jgi:hypothetical protein
MGNEKEEMRNVRGKWEEDNGKQEGEMGKKIRRKCRTLNRLYHFEI